MLKTLKSQTEYCLKNYPETRNSDITLMIEIWKQFYPQRLKVGKTNEQGIWLKDLYDLPNIDSIGRMRQKFNQQGLYLPTSEEVKKVRGIKETIWRENLGYPVNGYDIHRYNL